MDKTEKLALGKKKVGPLFGIIIIYLFIIIYISRTVTQVSSKSLLVRRRYPRVLTDSFPYPHTDWNTCK